MSDTDSDGLRHRGRDLSQASRTSTTTDDIIEGYYDPPLVKPRLQRSASISSGTSSMASRVTKVSSSKRLRPNHHFAIMTFTKPTYCDLCSQFIWGMYKQGEQCVGCGYNAHRKCAFSVKTPCNAFKLVDEPLAESTSIMAEIMAQASKESKKSETIVQDMNPKLSVTTFLKNNNRFVLRQGPVIWLNETILSLVTWQNPVTTLAFLLGYSFLCLYPILIAIVPHGLILYFVITTYHQRAEAIVLKKPIPPPPPLGTPPSITVTPTQMKDYIQSIQNTMGAVADVYDTVYTGYKLLDWTYPEKTADILKITLASIIPTLIVAYLIPINYIALVGGVGLFLANTALVKAAGITLAPVLLNSVRKHMDVVREAVSEAKKKQKGSEIVVVVTVFENQRWWAGMGFVPFLLKAERGQWTDETGTLSLPPKDLYELPSLTDTMSETEIKNLFGPDTSSKVWEWMDSDWDLDLTWHQTDTNGWVYYDQFWQNGRPFPAMLSVTRRRKWARRMKLETLHPLS